MLVKYVCGSYDIWHVVSKVMVTGAFIRKITWQQCLLVICQQFAVYVEVNGVIMFRCSTLAVHTRPQRHGIRYRTDHTAQEPTGNITRDRPWATLAPLGILSPQIRSILYPYSILGQF